MLKISPDEQAVLTMGTVCERKGQIDLVKAIGRLSEEHAALTCCLIVGKCANEYAGRLKKVLKTLPYSRRSRIELVEETSDPALYYAAAEITLVADVSRAS